MSSYVDLGKLDECITEYIDPYVEGAFDWMNQAQCTLHLYFTNLLRQQQLAIIALLTGLGVTLMLWLETDVTGSSRFLHILLLVCCSGWCVQPMLPVCEPIVTKMTLAYIVLAILCVQSSSGLMMYMWISYVCFQYGDIPHPQIAILLQLMVTYCMIKRVCIN
jgi:hypothetical protein